MADAVDLPVSARPWLTVIGIGEDGIAGLGDEAKRLIAAADVVFGGRRHLELAGGLIRGESQVWSSPLDRSSAAIQALRGRSIVVLASGDPFFYGMGATLSRTIPVEEMRTIPAPSSFSLAASRLGWPLQDVATVSLHGRPLELVLPHLQPGARILALTSDEKGPGDLAALLLKHGFGASRLWLLETLGGPAERITSHTAAGFERADIDPLNLCAIEVEGGEGARVLPLGSGRDDGLFENDGQITKREVRALTLSALAPRRGELLWDVGAGSGSIAIEWMLAHPAMRAIAIEANADRVERIGRNARSFGVPGLEIIKGVAPAALGGLPRPDAVFVGGGGSEAGVMEAVLTGLKPSGRLVANAVTLEMEAILLDLHRRLGGQLLRVDISRASPVGTMIGWRPAMPVTQWSWTKPENKEER